ncbi:MAG: hypothetical protein ACR2N5_06475, partial [Solirubrobacterales bacterium]
DYINDGGGGGSAEPGAELEQLDADAFTVDVPTGWDVAVGPEAEAGDPPGTVRSTQLTSPDGSIRLTINRRPTDPRTPEEQAASAEQSAADQPGYRRLRYEPTTVGGRETFLWQFEKSDAELGDAEATAYFLNFGGDAYRIQGNAVVSGQSPEEAALVARQAAATLEPVG